MVEVYLNESQIARRPSVVAIAELHSGRCTFEEDHRQGICLTAEFSSLEKATSSFEALRGSGFHVEGPYDY
jgi:hypothetical protein